MYYVKPPSIDWSVMTPMAIVLLTGVLGLILEMIQPKKNQPIISAVSVGGLLMAAITLFGQLRLPPTETMAGMVSRDGLSLVLQIAIVVVGFVSLLFSDGYLEEKTISFGEFYPLVVFATLGGMIMVNTFSLLMMFIGLEILSISLYVLAGLSRKEAKSEESALKYFLLGAFASAFFLYGIAFLYGASGSVSLGAVETAWQMGTPASRNLILFGYAMILIGFGFKAALFPFHQWAPDVYQGAPTNVTGFMAAASKVAAIGALLRIFQASVPLGELWVPALMWIAILTMTVGNIAACVQKDVKRILGYSSISNAGYVLAAICAHLAMRNKVPADATMFYLVSYSLMTLGAFAVITLVAKNGREGTRLADLNGLWNRAPLAAGALIIFVASLIGIPGTGGFIAKYYIFNDLLTANLVPLAIALAVNSAISVYYYLGIAHAAIVAEEGAIKNESADPNFGTMSAAVLCAAGVLVLFFLNGPIMNFIGVAVQ